MCGLSPVGCFAYIYVNMNCMNSHASAKEGSEERKLLAFFRAEATGGGLLVVAAAVGVIFANSGLSGWYENLRHLSIGVDLPWGA